MPKLKTVKSVAEINAELKTELDINKISEKESDIELYFERPYKGSNMVDLCAKVDGKSWYLFRFRMSDGKIYANRHGYITDKKNFELEKIDGVRGLLKVGIE